MIVTYVLLLEVLVILLPEDLTEKISNVAKDNQDEIGDVGGEKIVVGWIVLHRVTNGHSLGMLRNVTMGRMAQRGELSMLAGQFP